MLSLNRTVSDSAEWSISFADARGRAWRALRSYSDDEHALTSIYHDET